MSENLEDLSQNNLQEPTPPVSSAIPTPIPTPVPTPGSKPTLDESKTPFAEKPVSISGMTASVLNPRSEDERAKIEKEIEKRKNNPNGQSLMQNNWVRIILILVIVFIIFVPGLKFVNKTLVVTNKIIKSIPFFKNKEVKVLAINKVVIERNFRLVITTTPIVDKTNLIIGTPKKVYTNYSGKLLAKDTAGNKLWEFSVTNLKRGKYTIKYYAKNTRNSKFVFATDTFIIK